MDGSVKKDVDKNVKISEDLFEEYRGHDRATWADQVVEDRDFVFGKQWKEEDAEALLFNNQAAPAINEVTPAIEQVISQLTANNPRFTATAREDSDVKTADVIGDLVQHIWYTSKGRHRVRKSIRDYEIDGMGVLMAYIDPYKDNGKGEICIKEIDPLEVYIDPASREDDSSDAGHIIISQLITKSQVKDRYPSVDLSKAVTDEHDEPESDRYAEQDQITGRPYTDEKLYRTIDRYTKIKVNRYHVYDPNSGFEKVLTKEDYIEYAQKPAAVISKVGQPDRYVTNDYEVRESIKLAEETGGIYHLQVQNNEMITVPGAEVGNAIPNSTTRIEVTTVGQLLTEGAIKYRTIKADRIKRVLSVGRLKVYEDILPITSYPIVTFKLHGNRNPYPMGDVRLVKPIQEQINKIQSQIIAYNANITNVKAFVPQGSTDIKDLRERWGKAGAQLFEYNAEEGVPVIVQLTQMSSALYQEKTELINQIQRIIGAYAFQDGAGDSAPNTYRGTLAIDEMGQRRVRAKKEAIEAAIEQLGKVILEMIPNVYTERKIVRIVRPNNTVREVVINQFDPIIGQVMNDVTMGAYDLTVIGGSMLPSNRFAELEFLLEMWERGIITNPAVILRKTDLPDIEDEIKRQDIIAQQQQTIGQLEETIKNLQGDMQTLQRENLHNKEKVEVEKFKTKLDASASDMEAATLLAKQRLSDSVKQNKAQNGRDK